VTKQFPKVCILSTVHELHDSRIFYKEAHSLREFGFDVSFIVQHEQSEVIDGIQIIPLGKSKSRLKRMTVTVWEAWRKAMKQAADVYHFHDPELIPVGLLLKAMGKKVIYDVHEDVPRQILAKTWIVKPLRRVVAAVFERFEHFAAKRMDTVVTVTPFIRDRFLKINCQVFVVHNYPKLAEFPLHRSPQVDDEQTVCYIGGITRIRGLIEMVEAIGRTNSKLLLAGSFSSDDLRRDAIALQGWGQVEELGQLNREQVSDTLRRASAGIYAGHPIINYIDALPIKLFEYMASGIPVISSNFPLLKDIVERYKCGLCIDPLEPQAIADAIQWINDHPKEAVQMGDNGRAAVEECFNWESESRTLFRLYNQLLDLERTREY
jgi:glycosyltransferase involved in cell wall biosynthesis